jgi:hypothetical protein
MSPEIAKIELEEELWVGRVGLAKCHALHMVRTIIFHIGHMPCKEEKRMVLTTVENGPDQTYDREATDSRRPVERELSISLYLYRYCYSQTLVVEGTEELVSAEPQLWSLLESNLDENGKLYIISFHNIRSPVRTMNEAAPKPANAIHGRASSWQEKGVWRRG